MSICWGLAIVDDDALENSVDVLADGMARVQRRSLCRWELRAAMLVGAVQAARGRRARGNADTTLLLL
jgi:hypothetical protein